MRYSCFFLLRIIYDTDQSRTEQPVADAVSPAHFFQDLVVGKIIAIDTLERLVHTGIEARSNGLHRLHIERAQHIFHLFHDEFDAGA